MIRTLRDFLEEVGGLSFDNGDFWAVRDKFRDQEIQEFVKCFLPGTQILRDGKNGAPVAMKGLADDNKALPVMKNWISTVFSCMISPTLPVNGL